MRCLNQGSTVPQLFRVKDAAPEGHSFEVRGRKFILDKNSLALYEGCDEGVQLSTCVPQFPFHFTRTPYCLVFEITHRCNIACTYCWTGDTKISLLTGEEIEIRDLVDRGEFWVYSIDPVTKKVVPGKATAHRTRENAELVAVTLDNGERVRCTPDHRWMLRDGSYRQAQDLKPGDSLMPLYRKVGKCGYEKIYDPRGYWVYTHRRVCPTEKGFVAHHKDYNKTNNTPHNLQVMEVEEHYLFHARHISHRIKNDPEFREKLRSGASKAFKRIRNTPEFIAKWKKAWSKKMAELQSDPVWREKQSERNRKAGKIANKKRIEQGIPCSLALDSYTDEGKQRRRATMKRLRQDPEFNKKSNSSHSSNEFRRKRSEWMKKAYQDPEYKRMMTLRQVEGKRKKLKNHRVVSVEKVVEREDVFCLSVPGYENFALSAGVFVHNCFVSTFYDDQQGNLSLEVAKNAIHRLVDMKEIRRANRFSIGFFGGEPLVNYQGLVAITQWCEEYFRDIKLGKSVTTNAIQMTPDKAKWFKEHGFSFIVSLDGPERLHNRYRKTKNGEGTFDLVMRGLRCMNDAGIHHATLRSTFLPSETNILERVKFLNDLCDQGMANWVSVEPACLSESRCVDHLDPNILFTVEGVAGLRDEYLSCADWFVSRVKEGKVPRFHVISKTIERLLYRIPAPSECFSGDTRVFLLNGKNEKIEDLVDKGDLWVLGYDVSRQKVVPARAIAKETGYSSDMYEVELDNGEKVKCTGNHEWMLRDGSYRQARDLKPGDSLMPLYIKETEAGYCRFKNPRITRNSSWKLLHHLVAEEKLGWDRSSKDVIHHSSFDKHNNDPRFLEVMSVDRHSHIHAISVENGLGKWNSPENIVARRSVSRKAMLDQLSNMNSKLREYLHSDKNVQHCREMSRVQREDDQSSLNRFLRSEENKRKLKRISVLGSRSFKARLKQDEQLRSFMSENSKRKSREWYSKEENRKKLSDSVKASWAKNKDERARKAWETRRKNQESRANNHKVIVVRKIQEGHKIYCLSVEGIHNFALSAGVFVHNCGAGVGYMGVGPDGSIFSCHREINSYIGNLDKGGIDESLRSKWIDNRSYIRPKCCECPIQYVCGGGCRETSVGATGDIRTPDPISCVFKQIFFDCALWIMSECTEEELRKVIKNPVEMKMKQNRL